MADTPARVSVLISTTSNETVLTGDGRTAYVAGLDGRLSVYELETGTERSSWAVGKQLSGMTLAADGRFAVATEQTPVSMTIDQYGGRTYTYAVHRVDLSNGAVKDFVFTPTYSYDGAFFDAATLSNGKIFLTQRFLGSGWITPRTLDLDTGMFEALPTSYRQDSVLSSSLNGSKMLLSEANISNALLNILTVDSPAVWLRATNDSQGFNRGFQAISADGRMVANYVYGVGILVFDGYMNYLHNLSNTYPKWHYGFGIQGLAFNADGTTLYVTDAVTDRVVAISTTDWSITASIDAGSALNDYYVSGNYGNNLLVSDNGEYVVLTHADGVQRIDTTSRNGTTDSDVMSGDAGINKLYGLDGDDSLAGLGGDDRPDGGSGNDRLDGGAGDDRLFGGAGDDVLTGGSGNDLLDGGEGIDRTNYTGFFRSYAVRGAGTTLAVQGSAVEGTDTLTNVEQIIFQDREYRSDVDSVGATIIRLYDTVLDRAPEATGLDYWIDQVEDNGVSVSTVAGHLAYSAEFQTATGGLPNPAFVDFVYRQALGRDADLDGKAFWTARLDGGLSRGELLLEFSESDEHRAAIEETVLQGYFQTDDSYQAVALLYDGLNDRLPDAPGLNFWAGR
jgi:Ca2+-binding RTX toxin-like protein